MDIRYSVPSYVSLSFQSSLSSSLYTTLPGSPDLPPPHPHPTGPMQQATLHRQSQDQPLAALRSSILDSLYYLIQNVKHTI